MCRRVSRSVGEGMKRKEDENDEQDEAQSDEETWQQVDEAREPRANHLMY